MAKYLKLGPRAASFFDPSTRKKVLKGQIAKFSAKELKSEKTKAAILGRHLVEADSSEVEKFFSPEKEEKVKQVESPITPDDSDDDENEDLKSLTKDQLISKINEEYDLDDEESARVKKLKKDELVEYYQNLLKEDEEEGDSEDEEEDE